MKGTVSVKEHGTSDKPRSKISKFKKKKSKGAIQKKIDAHKPKKPPTAFFFFLEDFRKVYQQENPQVKSMRDVGKACGEKWKTMTYEEKVEYYDIAAQKRVEFDIAMAEYLKKKDLGAEDQASDLDGDDDEDYSKLLTQKVVNTSV